MPQTGAKTLRVKDVFDIDKSLAVIVPNQTPFPEVVRKFASRTDLRGIFLVDEEETLTGVITRQDLLHWAADKLHVPDPDRDAWRDVYRIMKAATAQEAARPGSADCSVQTHEPIQEVLKLMYENDIIDIPVVDADGRILGDVRLSEVLAKVFDHEARQ